jgi:pimeloyl-ACP methyl ester carboxylesterase
MLPRKSLALALSSVLLSACGGGSNSPRAVPTPPPTNGNGNPVTGVIAARFDPGNADPAQRVIPLPNNLLLSGTTDLTLNIPVADPNNFGDPQVAVNALDGWSTTAPWTLQFSAKPKLSTIVAGSSLRVFEVTLTGPGGGVTGVVRELASPADYVVAPVSSDTSGRTIAIVPTRPLRQLTSYMAVATGAITDENGNDSTPDQTYFLTKRTSPLCVNGASTEPLLPAATACSLEPLRQLTNSHLAAAGSQGIAADKVVVSWVATTQSITPVLQAAVGKVNQTPAPLTRIAPTGLTLANLNLGLAPIADVYIGTIDLPYYQTAAVSNNNPGGVLSGFWKAAPGAYVPPFNQAGLSPTSTNVTFANPFPVATKTETVPLILTVPNAASGKPRPTGGWPIVIFQHGITRNRTDAFAIAQTLASQGFAVIAIDMPLHGIVDPANPFKIENTPLAATGAHERTFNLDIKGPNSSCPPGATSPICPDGTIDGSGSYFINLTSLLTSRDNIRQAVVDLFSLSRAVPTLNYDGVAGGDFGAVYFVGQSLGSIVGTSFAAFDPAINTALLSVPGGGIARMLEASPTFGPQIIGGLGAAGLQPGTPNYDRFFGAAQQAIDSADPVNTAFALAGKAVLVHEVVGGGTVKPDQVIPNSVATSPTSGTEPLIRALGATAITASVQSPTPLHGAVRFIQGDHGSLLNPAASAAATTEMQRQMASFLLSDGKAVQVTDTSVIKTQ